MAFMERKEPEEINNISFFMDLDQRYGAIDSLNLIICNKSYVLYLKCCTVGTQGIVELSGKSAPFVNPPSHDRSPGYVSCFLGFPQSSVCYSGHDCQILQDIFLQKTRRYCPSEGKDYVLPSMVLSYLE